MPYYDHNKDYPFAAFITNLGKYNEGELVGEWVKFPTTAEELKEVFKRIGIGQKDDFGQPYEEWFITDYHGKWHTGAFAVAAEQPEKDNPLRTAEMTLEDDYGMIDGVINNGRRGEELEKAQEYAERTTPEKPSIRERLEDAKRECAGHKPPEGKKLGRDVPEQDCL